MKEHGEEEEKLRQYLLGELTLEQQVLIEQRLFLDDKFSQLAQTVEDELIDDYAYHDLTVDERARFENHFLRSLDHYGDLRIAQALKRFLISQPIINDEEPFLHSLFRRRLVIGLSFAAFLIILCVIGWNAFRSLRKDGSPVLQGQHQSPIQTPPDAQRNSNDARPEETANRSESNRGAGDNERQVNERSRPENQRSSSRSTMVVAIPPGAFTRGEEQNSRNVKIFSETETLILRLPLSTTQDYNSYLAMLKSRGHTVHSFPNLKSEADDEWGKVVPVKVPARMLRSQNYEIELSGISDDQRPVEPTIYGFHVERK